MNTVIKLLKWTALAGCLLTMMACRPLPYYLERPDGPPDYKLGWQDGCDTKLSTSPGFYRLIYGFKKRPEMIGNNLYNQGWSNGYLYCSWP